MSRGVASKTPRVLEMVTPKAEAGALEDGESYVSVSAVRVAAKSSWSSRQDDGQCSTSPTSEYPVPLSTGAQASLALSIFGLGVWVGDAAAVDARVTNPFTEANVSRTPSLKLTSGLEAQPQ